MAENASPIKSIALINWHAPANSVADYERIFAEGIIPIVEEGVKSFQDAAPEKTGKLRKGIHYVPAGKMAYNILMPWYGRITIKGWGKIRTPKHAKFLKIELKDGQILYRRKAGPIPANPWQLAGVRDIRQKVRELLPKTAKKLVTQLERRIK
jgi:hypothetical protein